MAAATVALAEILNFEKPIIDAFIKDCRKLLLEYEKLETFKYDPFARLWVEMNFTMVFAGQTFAAELKVFTEMCFYVLKKFLFHKRSLYTQIGALYTIFGLYYKQPLKQWTKIRLTLDDFQQLESLTQQIHTDREPLYVYAKLRHDGAFKYVATEAPLALEHKFMRNYGSNLEEKLFVEAAGHDPVESLQRILYTNGGLVGLREANDKYLRAMRKFAEERPSDVLTVFDSSVVQELENGYEALRAKVSDDGRADEDCAHKRTKDKAFKTMGGNYRMRRPK